MNWPAIALILIGLAGLGGFGMGVKYEKGVVAANEVERKQGWSDALEATAKELAKIQVVQRTINRQVEVQTKEVPVYRECQNTPDVVKTINAAARGEVAK